MAAITGARIKALREHLDLEAGQLAYKANVDRSYIFYIERGERPNVSGVILGRIADALSTSVDYLLARTNDPTPPAGHQGPDPRIIMDAETMARVSPRVRRYALEILEIFSELEEVAPDLLDRAANIIWTQAELVRAATEGGRQQSRSQSNTKGEHAPTITTA